MKKKFPLASDSKVTKSLFDFRIQVALLFMLGIVAITCCGLAGEGRIWWCQWDTPFQIWSSGIWSKHNSQHFFDPYSFTHFLHGFLFYWLGKLIFRGKLSFIWFLCFAVFCECCWELVENSNFVIDQYRKNTISLNYTGDSIANSVGDIASCAIGFCTAYYLRVKRSIVVFFVIEIVLMLLIRDSLLINIVMLFYPLEFLREWQGE